MCGAGNTLGQDLNLNMERLRSSRNFTNKLWNAGKFIDFNLAEVCISNRHLNIIAVSIILTAPVVILQVNSHLMHSYHSVCKAYCKAEHAAWQCRAAVVLLAAVLGSALCLQIKHKYMHNSFVASRHLSVYWVFGSSGHRRQMWSGSG